MSYSANSYESPFYGVGCATATDLMGTWTKYDENPLLQKPGKLVGVGHSAMFTDKAGKLRIVYHAQKIRITFIRVPCTSEKFRLKMSVEWTA